MAKIELDDLPSRAEDIDVDRTVWDPVYREAAMVVLARDQDHDAKTDTEGGQ